VGDLTGRLVWMHDFDFFFPFILDAWLLSFNSASCASSAFSLFLICLASVIFSNFDEAVFKLNNDWWIFFPLVVVIRVVVLFFKIIESEAV